MKKQRVDYSGFSLRRIREPRFAHALLLLDWLAYFAMYFLTENLIPLERCHVIHCFVDDVIPFSEGFVIFYVGWYLLVAGALAYTFFYDVENFRRLQIFLIITQALAMLCYIVYPSVQNLRPAVFPRQNAFTWLLGIIYGFDTPTGVCPSLHVAYSVGILSVALKDRDLSGWLKAALAVVVVLICMAVCFVKQHSFVDVLAALPVCLIAEIAVFGKDYWKPRLRRLFLRAKKITA
jgi:membrane-associated phospholipid phosphatase